MIKGTLYYSRSRAVRCVRSISSFTRKSSESASEEDSFVSAQKGNSNALTALNTAASLAYAGKKVILVDW